MTSPRALGDDLRTYLIGYLLALALTLSAFAVVYYRAAPAGPAFAIILALALAQIVVHMRCFLHMSVQRSARSDLMLVLFSILIIALMVGGTLVILANLHMRMM